MIESFEMNINFEDDYFKAVTKSLDISREFNIDGENEHKHAVIIKVQSIESYNLTEEKSDLCNNEDDRVSIRESLSSEIQEKASQVNLNKKSTQKYNIPTEVLYAVNMMYNLYEEKEKSLEERNKLIRKQLLEDNREILSFESLNQKLQNCQDTVHHLTRVKEDYHKLKELLRSNNTQDVWKIHINCHRFVVQFFEIADKLLRNIEDDITCAEWNCKVDLQQHNIVSLLHIFQDQVAKLHITVDAILEYRSCAKDLYNSTL